MKARRGLLALLLLVVPVCITCSNNPYSDADAELRVRYRVLPSSPKTIDPAVNYSALEHAITANVYETLLEYHYLKRPYELMPGLASALPRKRTLPDGKVEYVFRLRPGMLYQSDPSFSLSQQGRDTREIVAADVAFELMRIGDPDLASPVVATFSRIEGFPEFAQRLKALREEDPAFGERRIDEQYAAAGGVAGLVAEDPYELRVVLSAPFPQILYWFAMPFTSPVPWEAVEYYDGEDGRKFFREHAVSSGPFQILHYDKRSRVVLERNPNWYGALHPEWKAPGTVYPSEGEPGDAERGLLDERYVGRSLPFLDRIDYRIEKETIPVFNKFLQGYYDAAGIIRESFDKVVREGRLSDEMAARGVRLVKSVNPDVSYVGFNMEDPVVGRAGGERSRKLRQAMSLAIDIPEYTRIFSNGRGVPAQTPLAPGLFGYDASYRNPYRTPDFERAQALLAEAGYPGGVDPATGAPLKLSFDLGSTDTQSRLAMQFFLDAWRKLGLDIKLAATNYNEFRDKLRRNAYQMFRFGWIADYPDPENFLFLLWGDMAQSRNSGAPNTANFQNAEYDALYSKMRDMENGSARLAIIGQMLEILERERPWIELTHSEGYSLYHEWIHNVKPSGIGFPTDKYVAIDPVLREARRTAWNEPVLWPAYGLSAIAIAVAIPGIVTFMRERQ
jgi:ABC-type transport system substrate-binding protein